MALPRPQRGFSLVEVLTASAVSLVAVAAASQALVGQYMALQSRDLSRTANGAAREATQFLDSTLRMTGFGVDPRWAIDFSYRCASQPCRDSATGPDELVVVSRDPRYRYLVQGEGGCTDVGGCFSGNAWPITAATTGPASLTVTLQPGTSLEAGRMVQALCAGGQFPVMLTLAAPVSLPSSSPAGDVILNRFSADPTLGPYNDTGSLRACHGQPGAALFLVDRSRFFVQTLNGTPWLMLDTGRDLDGDGILPPADQDDLIPVSKNVLDLQIAYALDPCTGVATGPDSNGDWMIGNAKGVREEPLLNTSPAAPVYGTASTDPSRCTLNPANVRALRVTLRLRSDRADHAKGDGWAGDRLVNAENRSDSLNVRGHRLFTTQLDVTLRNMTSTASFIF
ncbi:MAG TPA: prepilin-type N-terminal cleavage/methylation domain-containing protein [Myxococcaceae bacterium]|nr:prepilin-type N-terminal cleavage/methylation domain-containing protein [Myxococcaceae bacterium]